MLNPTKFTTLVASTMDKGNVDSGDEVGRKAQKTRVKDLVLSKWKREYLLLLFWTKRSSICYLHVQFETQIHVQTLAKFTSQTYQTFWHFLV